MNTDETVYVVILWYHGPKGRPFDTISHAENHLPNAYSLNFLQEYHFPLLHASTLVHTEEELRSWTASRLFPTVTRKNPLLVPLPLARKVLGWHDFHFVKVPEE